MIRIIPAIDICATLAACSTTQIAATATKAKLSPANIAYMQQTCAAVEPAVTAAVAPSMPAKVSGTAIFIEAYCSQLIAGTVPSTTDTNTPTWLRNTISILGYAAKAAGVILPLVL